MPYAPIVVPNPFQVKSATSGRNNGELQEFGWSVAPPRQQQGAADEVMIAPGWF
jgi:hypothetical protein